MAEMKELNLDQMEQVTGGELLSGAYAWMKGNGKEKIWIKYHVQEGDTLWDIHKRYKCTVWDIRKWNCLKTDTIGPWMVLDLYTDRY